MCGTTEAPKKLAVIKTPVLIKFHIFKLMAGSYSLRNIGLILAYLNVKIGRTTLQKWFTEEKKGQESAKVLFLWYWSTQKNDKRFCVTRRCLF